MNNDQHNIMALIGNGFDIALFNFFPRTDNLNTSYSSFISFLNANGMLNSTNIIYSEILKILTSMPPIPTNYNWADFGNIIGAYVSEHATNSFWLSSADTVRLKNSVLEIQQHFNIYLHTIIDTNLINTLNNYIKMHPQIIIDSLSKF